MTNTWLWRLVTEAKKQELIEELNQSYPWHKYQLTAKGKDLISMTANV